MNNDFKNDDIRDLIIERDGYLEQVKELEQELQKKDNIINEIKEELNKNYNTYVCKNKSYGKTFKAGAETYKEHLLYKIKELENGQSND